MRLRELRLEKGLLQKDIAEFLGVERTTYTKYETEASELKRDALIKLAEFFDVSVDYLLGHTNQRKEPAPKNEDGLNVEQQELVSLFESASQALRAAALAVLRSGEEQASLTLAARKSEKPQTSTGSDTDVEI